jgi:hypothetical protein
LENQKALKPSKVKLESLRSVAISTGPYTHLDQLGVIAHLMGIPLIVTEPETYEIAKKFYPQIEVIYIPIGDLSLDYLATHFDVIYQCGKFWALELLPLFQLLYQKRMRLVFVPHGNSDKGHSLDLSQFPLGHDIALIYGNQMEDQLKKTGEANQTQYFVKTGNLRLCFYHKYKDHFDRFANQLVFSHFNHSKPVILYAPTWDTKESPTSFFECTSHLIEQLKENYHLIIKPHPLLEENHPAHFHYLISKYENKTNVLFLKDFPAIYPLLEKTSIYIGDYSSIGYDFLSYDRPLYFLNTKGETLLQKCGVLIEKIEGIKKILKKKDQLSNLRQETYRYAFGEKPNLESVKENIERRLHSQKE